MEADKKEGLIPFFVCATVGKLLHSIFAYSPGTTSTCAVDNIVDIGKLCKVSNVWLHVGTFSMQLRSIKMLHMQEAPAFVLSLDTTLTE